MATIRRSAHVQNKATHPVVVLGSTVWIPAVYVAVLFFFIFNLEKNIQRCFIPFFKYEVCRGSKKIYKYFCSNIVLQLSPFITYVT